MCPSPTSDEWFCQNLGLDPDFGHDRQKKQPRFESESRRWESRFGRRVEREH